MKATRKKQKNRKKCVFVLAFGFLGRWMFSLSSLVASKSNYDLVTHRHPKNPN
jgi:hypothetical protein